MRIIAMADSHGDRASLEKIFEATKDTGDIFVHLGDGESELFEVKKLYPSLDIRSVAGNCDHNSSSPTGQIIRTGIINVMITHGHRMGVEYGIQTLRSMAREKCCRAVLFGHTHKRFEAYEDGIYYLNPGSCALPRDGRKPSYGFIDITPSGIITNIVEL